MIEENQQQFCTDWEKKLAALQPATSVDDEAFKHHIEHCPQCAQRWHDYELMRTFVSRLPMTEPVPPFPSRLREVWNQEESESWSTLKSSPQRSEEGRKEKRRKSIQISSYSSSFSCLKKDPYIGER